MKRGSRHPSQAVSEHLQGIREALMRLREDFHHYFVCYFAGRTHLHGGGALQWGRGGQEAEAAQRSSNHFLRTCLHMYNALDEGLDYLDDPDRNVPEVEQTLACVNQVIETVLACHVQEISETPVVQGARQSILMLKNALEVLRDEMISPTEEVVAADGNEDAGLFGSSRARKRCRQYL